MIVDKVTMHGIRELYQYYMDLYEEPSVRITKETSSSDALSKSVHIYISLSDLTPFEAFILRLFTDGNVSFSDTGLLPLDAIREYQDRMNIKGLDIIYNRSVSLGNQMYNDSSVDNTMTTMMQIPIMYRLNAVVHYTGPDIYKLFGRDSFFDIFQYWLNGNDDIIRFTNNLEPNKKYNGFYTDENANMIYYVFPDDIKVFSDAEDRRNLPEMTFEDFIIKTFISGYYSYLNKKVSSLDAMADSYLYNKYLTSAPNFDAIITPQECIDMTGDTHLMDKINEIKDRYAYLLDDVSPSHPKDTFWNEISFVCTIKASFATFLRIWIQSSMKNLNDFIICWEDLKIVTARPINTKISGLERYVSRIRNSLEAITKTRDEIDPSLTLVKFNLIPFATPVTFMLSGSLSDYQYFADELRKKGSSDEYHFDVFFNSTKAQKEEDLKNGDFMEVNNMTSNEFFEIASYIESLMTTINSSFGTIIR